MVKQLEILLLGFLSLLFVGSVTSCTQSEEPIADSSEVAGSTTGAGAAAGAGVYCKFTIYTDEKSSASRALGVWEEDAINVAERILNVNDMKLLFFSQGGVLLKTVIPSSLKYMGSTLANDGYYMISAYITHEYFDNYQDDDTVEFTVMILANLNGIDGDYIDYTPGVTRIDDIKEFFKMAPSYFPTEESGIPMYGYSPVKIQKSKMLELSDATETAVVNMIRALCKIEVFDRIANAATGVDGLNYPHVVSVEMTSWNDHGYIRPRFDDYYLTGGLREARIYPNSVVTEPVTATYVDDGTFRFYCPEAKLSDMHFRVSAVHAPGLEPQTYEIDLSGFASGLQADELVRNHIYRFNVHALNTLAELNVTVSDWNVQTDEYVLDNVVSVESDGFLQWDFDPQNFAVSTETYNGREEQQLSILNATTSYATGSFFLQSPVGATWKAYFIPGENGVDAFEFVGEDGSASSYAEGSVGERATIRIRGKGAADAYRHWAELVVEVHTIDGSVLLAPLTSQMSSVYIIYRENRM